MEIRESKQEDVVILELEGRLDTKTAGDFEKKLLELLKGGQRRFVVDMGPIEYVSSAGLRVLLMLAKKLSGTEGGAVVLCALNREVRAVFDIAGFSSIFTITTTRDDAISALPSTTRGERMAAMAASALGAVEQNPLRPDTNMDDLVLRAVKALGVKVKVPGGAMEQTGTQTRTRAGNWYRT